MKKILILVIGLFVIGASYIFMPRQSVPLEITPIPQEKVPTPEQKISLVLKENGLGAVSFGASPEETIATLTPVLGAPTRDTGWVDSFSTYGTCPGNTMRGVEWGSLHVFFGDTPQYGKKTFFGFEYVNRSGSNNVNLATEKGITLGTTKEEIKRVYPDATFGEWLPGQIGTTFVRGISGDGKYLGGTIEDNKLFWIGGGVLCGE